MQIICMDRQCLKKFPQNGFKRVEDLSQFNDFLIFFLKNNGKCKKS